MTLLDKVVQLRHHVIQRAAAGIAVTWVGREAGISRTLFYRIAAIGCKAHTPLRVPWTGRMTRPERMLECHHPVEPGQTRHPGNHVQVRL